MHKVPGAYKYKKPKFGSPGEKDHHVSGPMSESGHDENDALKSSSLDEAAGSLSEDITPRGSVLDTSSSYESACFELTGFREDFHAGKEYFIGRASIILHTCVDMELLVKNYEMEAVKADHEVDGVTEVFLRYKMTLPLNPPKPDLPSGLEVFFWCSESEERPYVIEFELVKPCSDDLRQYFERVQADKRFRSVSISKFISSFYDYTETLWYPGTFSMTQSLSILIPHAEPIKILIRDYAYPPQNPLHFGHLPPKSTAATENYPAKVIYSFESSMAGEMSVELGDILTVMKNLGNGWVSARRKDGEMESGLVPENYVQRI